MKTWLAILAGLCMTAAFASADPGIQVVACEEMSPDVWHYDFFTCTGDFEANDLHIQLTPEEIAEGTIIMGCSIPDLPGYSCEYTATEASWVFPILGTFECVPGVSGYYLDIEIFTMDEFTRVYEIWTLNGDVIASFSTSISCPPVAVESSTWGNIKSMFE